MRLHLVRHPRPVATDGLCYGSSEVAAIVDDRLLAQLLAMLPRAVPLYTSPLKRCLNLAAALAPALGSGPPISDPRLAEMHFGTWEMQPWSDISRVEVDAWAADLIHHRPGGGESVLQVAQRLQAFRKEMAAKEGEAVVICHAGTIRLLSAPQMGLEELALSAARQAHAIAYGSVTVVDVQRP
jgi:alpha-ribazole phosphatase